MANMAEFMGDLFVSLAEEKEEALPKIDALYAKDMHFEDPMVKLESRDAFVEMNRRLLRRSKAMQVEVTSSAESGNDLFLTWIMKYQARLGPRLTIKGATHARRQNGNIVYQRDYWDLASSLMDSLPGLGPLYQRVVRLFA